MKHNAIALCGGIYAPECDIPRLESGEITELIIPVGGIYARIQRSMYAPGQRWYICEPWSLRKNGYIYRCRGDKLTGVKDAADKWMPAKDMPVAAARIIVRIDSCCRRNIDTATVYDAMRSGYASKAAMRMELTARYGPDAQFDMLQVTVSKSE